MFCYVRYACRRFTWHALLRDIVVFRLINVRENNKLLFLWSAYWEALNCLLCITKVIKPRNLLIYYLFCGVSFRVHSGLLLQGGDAT